MERNFFVATWGMFMDIIKPHSRKREEKINEGASHFLKFKVRKWQRNN